MKLWYSVSWMLTEWSWKLTEWHSSAIKSPFSYRLVTFQMTEWHSFVMRSVQLFLPRTLCAYSTHQCTCTVWGIIKMVRSCFYSQFSFFEMVIISIVHVLKMSLISILRKYMYMPSLLGSVSTATNLHSVSPSLFSGCDLPIDGSSHTALELHLPGFFVCVYFQSFWLYRGPLPPSETT